MHDLKIVENNPLDTIALERMIADPEDLQLVWPAARFPFDHEQWRNELDPADGTVSFLVYGEDEHPVGHGALAKMGEKDPRTVMIRFLYIVPELRNKGTGRKLLSFLEEYAREKMGAHRLILKVRTYNHRALACYGKYGFIEYSRDGTLVMMEKGKAGAVS